jgi:hypothetical protein
MASKVPFVKSGFKSKTLVTQCGYCFKSLKSENLKTHCKNVHSKPMLSFAERPISCLLKTVNVCSAPSNVTESASCPKANPRGTLIPDNDEDQKSPPKKRKFSSAFCDDEVENAETYSFEVTDSSHVTVTDDFDPTSAEQENLVPNIDLENNNSNKPIKENNNNFVAGSSDVKLGDLAEKLDALKVSVDGLRTRIVPDIAKPPEVQPNESLKVGVCLDNSDTERILTNLVIK